MTQGNGIIIRGFQPDDAAAFRDLNMEWIKAFFAVEEMDRKTLEHPRESILDPGGEILMAIRNGERVGCVALVRMADGGFELAKMAVATTLRGQGTGHLLMQAAIDKARERGAPRIYIESSTSLPNAIHLYRSYGFRELGPDEGTPSPYARCDIRMELHLEDGAAQTA